MRTCRYEVVGEVEQEKAAQFFSDRWVVDDYSDEEEHDEDDRGEEEWDEEEDADPNDRIDREGPSLPDPRNLDQQPATRRLFRFWPF